MHGGGSENTLDATCLHITTGCTHIRCHAQELQDLIQHTWNEKTYLLSAPRLVHTEDAQCSMNGPRKSRNHAIHAETNLSA